MGWDGVRHMGWDGVRQDGEKQTASTLHEVGRAPSDDGGVENPAGNTDRT